MQAYWLVVRVLLTPPAAAAASQKWKIIYFQVLSLHSGGPLQAQLFTFSAVVVLVAVLVFGLPLTKRHHEHAKGLVLSPEPVLDAGRWYSREQLEQMLEHGGNGVE